MLMIGLHYGHAGEPITIEGYAQDFKAAVAAMQFSCDQGRTWTTYLMKDMAPDCNVNWSFTFTPDQPGLHELLARARNTFGETTPEPASIRILVQ
jgi:hypothetical protein